MRSPRKKPSQRRSELTVDAILEAAARIFAAQGYRATTTAKVAEYAGVSIGSLYQYFPNKLALLAGVKQRHLRTLFVELDETLARSTDIQSGLRAAVRLNLTRSLASRSLLLVFAEELPARLAPRETPPSDSPPVTMIRRFLYRCRRELPGRDPALAALVVTELVDAVTRARLAEKPEDLASGLLEHELMTVIGLYLRGQRA